MTNLITEARQQTAVANARTVYSIASAEAAFATASGSPITAGTYDDAEDGDFYTDVTLQAGEFDGTFSIVVGTDNTVTSVTYDAGDDITGIYPTPTPEDD
jgi:hypothetical protein